MLSTLSLPMKKGDSVLKDTAKYLERRRMPLFNSMIFTHAQEFEKSF